VPIGAPQGISTSQPAASKRSAATRSGRIWKDLEPVLGERVRRFHEAEQVRLQRVIVADHLKLHPIGGKELPRHLRGANRLLRRSATRRVGHHAHTQRLDEIEEARARVATRLLAP